MYGSEAGEEELLLGDSTQLPYADYEQMLNRLSLSLGALAPPLFCKDGTNAMLYGGLLYFYARMLITAIDSAGVKFNAQGEFVSSWLSDSTKDTYEQRALHCLPGNTSIFPEVPAMEVAYAAFKRHHQANNIRLSEELTEEKVFFITACLATCAMTPADNLYGGDCNKAVMNFAPFAEAFSCPVGSKMNPASKCTFYD
ncbi:endothelin-converting enzyme 1-like [Dermacentor silvarum]|uniref:endothelin-converting enzyme 1-like n=1 Tax=Dermacentor silvarum TaxID=543639 RepID=UPI002101C104|nr:endothelin-converting enzyme 1-like [Dermacentor silvarum]